MTMFLALGNAYLNACLGDREQHTPHNPHPTNEYRNAKVSRAIAMHVIYLLTGSFSRVISLDETN